MQGARQNVIGERLAMVGGGVTIVGAFLPWVTVDAGVLGSVTKTGIDGDGTITLVLAVVAVVVLFARSWGLLSRAVALVAGLLTVVIGSMYIFDPAAGTAVSGSVAASYFHPQVGLYVTTLGGALLILGGATGLND